MLVVIEWEMEDRIETHGPFSRLSLAKEYIRNHILEKNQKSCEIRWLYNGGEDKKCWEEFLENQ